MKEGNEALAQGLLEKASHDLISARAILNTDQAHDMVCFHAQQAIEKVLKALLCRTGLQFALRHDLGELVSQATSIIPELASKSDAIAELTPYAVAARYDLEVSPSDEDAKAALDLAEWVVRLVNPGG